MASNIDPLKLDALMASINAGQAGLSGVPGSQNPFDLTSYWQMMSGMTPGGASPSNQAYNSANDPVSAANNPFDFANYFKNMMQGPAKNQGDKGVILPQPLAIQKPASVNAPILPGAGSNNVEDFLNGNNPGQGNLWLDGEGNPIQQPDWTGMEWASPEMKAVYGSAGVTNPNLPASTLAYLTNNYKHMGMDPMWIQGALGLYTPGATLSPEQQAFQDKYGAGDPYAVGNFMNDFPQYGTGSAAENLVSQAATSHWPITSTTAYMDEFNKLPNAVLKNNGPPGIYNPYAMPKSALDHGITDWTWLHSALDGGADGKGWDWQKNAPVSGWDSIKDPQDLKYYQDLASAYTPGAVYDPWGNLMGTKPADHSQDYKPPPLGTVDGSPHEAPMEGVPQGGLGDGQLQQDAYINNTLGGGNYGGVIPAAQSSSQFVPSNPWDTLQGEGFTNPMGSGAAPGGAPSQGQPGYGTAPTSGNAPWAGNNNGVDFTSWQSTAGQGWGQNNESSSSSQGFGSSPWGQNPWPGVWGQ